MGKSENVSPAFESSHVMNKTRMTNETTQVQPKTSQAGDFELLL